MPDKTIAQLSQDEARDLLARYAGQLPPHAENELVRVAKGLPDTTISANTGNAVGGYTMPVAAPAVMTGVRVGSGHKLHGIAAPVPSYTSISNIRGGPGPEQRHASPTITGTPIGSIPAPPNCITSGKIVMVHATPFHVTPDGEACRVKLPIAVEPGVVAGPGVVIIGNVADAAVQIGIKPGTGCGMEHDVPVVTPAVPMAPAEPPDPRSVALAGVLACREMGSTRTTTGMGWIDSNRGGWTRG